MEIILTRAEGPSHECNKPKSFANFADANSQLTVWSHTAPDKGGYDKVDFVIRDDKAQVEYAGRYDLKHWRVECAHLRGHVIGNLEFLAGDSRPHHMTPAQYDQFLAQYTKEWRGECRRVAKYFREVA